MTQNDEIWPKLSTKRPKMDYSDQNVDSKVGLTWKKRRVACQQ